MSIYLETANKQIEKGIVGLDVIKSNLAKHYLELDRQEFEAKLRAEYEALDIFEVKLKDKYVDNTGLLFDDVYDLYSAELPDSYPSEENDSIIQAKVDEILKLQLDDGRFTESVLKPDAPTFEEYKNETRVITEAVEATYDEDGMELTPAVAEVRELVRPYIANDVTDKVEAYLQPILDAKAKDESLEYLDSTDWVIAKIGEAQLLGEDVEILKEKYSDVLAKRVEAREFINAN